MAEIVDTNVILRYLVGDNKSQQEKAKSWFKEAEQGKRRLIIKPVVVAEACFVLESFYKKVRSEIADAFEVFLSQKWLSIEDKDTMTNLWKWYRSKLHFVDSYLLASLDTADTTLLTFDNKLEKLSKSA